MDETIKPWLNFLSDEIKRARMISFINLSSPLLWQGKSGIAKDFFEQLEMVTQHQLCFVT